MNHSDVDPLLDRHQQSFRSRSAETLAGDHGEHGTFDNPAAGIVMGRPEVQRVYEDWLAAFPDMDFIWSAPIVEGTRVALFWYFTGTVSGHFLDDVHPGTRVQFDGAAEYVVSPEGIVSARHLFDFTGALVLAGVLKVKPA